jgi:rhamnosyltransferase
MSDNKKIAFIIAHYHQKGHLTKNLFDHVKYIHRFTENIIFVSTHLNAMDSKKLEPYAKVIVRENKGYDFYSYKTGLSALDHISDVDHLIFFNSSFLTLDPKKLYKKYLFHINQEGFYGITSCSAPSYHIQSYFFSFFGKQLIQSKVFSDWWNKVELVDDRKAIIQKYEVGMTQWFVKHKTYIKSLYEPNVFEKGLILYRYLRLRHLNFFMTIKKLMQFIFRKKSLLLTKDFGCNPTHFLFDRIYKIFRIVKIELLVKNPTQQNLRKMFNELKIPEQSEFYF